MSGDAPCDGRRGLGRGAAEPLVRVRPRPAGTPAAHPAPARTGHLQEEVLPVPRHIRTFHRHHRRRRVAHAASERCRKSAAICLVQRISAENERFNTKFSSIRQCRVAFRQSQCH